MHTGPQPRCAQRRGEGERRPPHPAKPPRDPPGGGGATKTLRYEYGKHQRGRERGERGQARPSILAVAHRDTPRQGVAGMHWGGGGVGGTRHPLSPGRTRTEGRGNTKGNGRAFLNYFYGPTALLCGRHAGSHKRRSDVTFAGRTGVGGCTATHDQAFPWAGTIGSARGATAARRPQLAARPEIGGRLDEKRRQRCHVHTGRGGRKPGVIVNRKNTMFGKAILLIKAAQEYLQYSHSPATASILVTNSCKVSLLCIEVHLSLRITGMGFSSLPRRPRDRCWCSFD